MNAALSFALTQSLAFHPRMAEWFMGNGALLFKKDAALVAKVTFFRPRPMSHFDKDGLRSVQNLTGKWMEECGKWTYCTSVPDIDNMSKFVLDEPLEGLIYANDKNVVELFCRKKYDSVGECYGRTMITVRRVPVKGSAFN